MKPNVIIINCDDLGYGDLECYGSKVNDSPYVNKLAENGMLFTNAYAASPFCTPSRAGLLTACYPARVNVHRVLFPGEAQGLNSDEYTMGDMFKRNNYKTMIIGKWHLGDQMEHMPNNFGFDDYFGIPYSNDMGIQTGRLDFPPLPLIKGTEVIQEQPDQCSVTERYTEKAVSFIRENKDNNFFLYLAHMHVHLPLYAQETFMKASRNGDFGACVSEMDWSCGVIMNELKRLNLEENTIIIFTSDNGAKGEFGSSNAPFRGRKGTTYEGGVRIPLIIVWKDKIQAGKINDNMITHMDLFPTLSELIGSEIEFPNKIDGISAVDNIMQGKSTRDVYAYFNQKQDRGNVGNSRFEAVRKGDYKLYLYRDFVEVRELYNLKDDISESINIFDENEDIVKELSEIFYDYEKRLGNFYIDSVGTERRMCKIVENPKPLTAYDPECPYIVAMYDKVQVG